MLSPAVLIVAFGPVDLLRECLDELDRDEDVIVVDNASNPLCRELVEQRGVEYVDPQRNLGFAAGVNRGLELIAHDRDVLLLNPDARLHSEDLHLLQGALHSHPEIAAVAPRLVHADGSPQETLWPLPSASQVWRDAFGLRSPGPFFLIGAVLLLRAEARVDVGNLDERFFLYAEEADWQQRALRRGWQVREVRAVTALHISGGTSSDNPTRDRHFSESNRLFAKKWCAGWRYRAWSIGSAAARLRRRVIRPQT